MAASIDLKHRFGDEYQITLDPSAGGRSADPWYYQIPCKNGTIYSHGGELLAVEVDNHPVVARRLAAISGIRLHQDGDREKTFVFPIELFEAVTAVVGPRRKRKCYLTPEQLTNLVEAGARYRFQTGT